MSQVGLDLVIRGSSLHIEVLKWMVLFTNPLCGGLMSVIYLILRYRVLHIPTYNLNIYNPINLLK